MLSSKFAIKEIRAFLNDMAENSPVKLTKAVMFGSMA
jgi:hypothetical protein